MTPRTFEIDFVIVNCPVLIPNINQLVHLVLILAEILGQSLDFDSVLLALGDFEVFLDGVEQVFD